MSDLVKIEGLAEFSRSLKRLDASAPKALRVALNEVIDVIVSTARPMVPHRSGRAAASLKAQSTRTLVRVSAGGGRAPYYPWLDFGGRVGKNRSVRRYFLKEGRYLYPTYNRLKSSGEVEDALRKALVGVAERSGLEVE